MSSQLPVSLWRRDGEIFLVSVLILYLEMVLIRWIGTEIRIFAYLGNLVLVVCFFGVGLGCYLSSRPISITRLGVNLFVLAFLIGNPLHSDLLDLKMVTFLLSGLEDSPIWGGGMPGAQTVYSLVGLAVLASLAYLIAFTFVPMGQMLGRLFQDHPRTIHAYSLNVAGSLAGVWVFNALSWYSTPPGVWFGLAAAMIASWLIVGRERSWVTVALVAATAAMVWCGRDRSQQTVWSPYQKLAVSPFFAEEGTNRVQQGYVVQVNDTFHYQHILNFSDGFFALYPQIFDPERVGRSHYNLPFSFKSNVKRLLIVGAGAGNNAAAALRHGVERIDCVEIDPRIYGLGKQLHPEHPYDSPRVHMYLNDARAFFKQATGPYDLIWFALLDAHTLGSSYNNLRLDHYVYTTESFREARRLLSEDGVMIVNFGAERMWNADRLYGVAKAAFGQEPFAYTEPPNPVKYGYGGGITLVCANPPLTTEAVQDRALRQYLEKHLIHLRGATRPTTDDWPYLYLERAKIPKLHLLTSLAILGTVAVARRRVLGLKVGLDWHFFALGAAFLLLEVQTVSRATLLFGMTWVVNAIVISAVLVMILLANLVAWRWPRLPQWLIVGALAATLALLALGPLDRFNALAGASKLVAASAFLTAPVFFGGLIFIRSFTACADKSQALGSNLIGALVGGLLESLSFVTGIRALVVLVGFFYVVALWSMRQRSKKLATASLAES